MSMAKSTTRPKRRKAQNTTYEAHVDVPDHLAPLASNDRIPIQTANPTHAIDDGLSLIEIAQHIAHAVGINTQRHAQRICELPTPCARVPHPLYPLPDRHPPQQPPLMYNAMALPGHSPPPPPFGGPSSPPRSLNGYNDSHHQYPMYGPPPRPMPPPSPHTYAPRYPQGLSGPPPALSASNYQNESRVPPPPQKRPGSSMSISSMLGSEPEKPHPQDLFRQPPRPHSTQNASMSIGAAMSPPQHPPRPAISEYPYKARARTPDRLGDSQANRYRSGSGSIMQRPGPFPEPQNHVESYLQQRYGGPPAMNSIYPRKDEAAERARRTSLSGILSRPDPEPFRPSMSSYPQNTSSIQPGPVVPAPVPSYHVPKPAPPPERSDPPNSSYDTRPPPSNPRPSAPPFFDYRQSRSPDIRRSQPNGSEPRGLAGLLNNGPENMARQDSAQSQNDRLGDRYRHRAFSPFTGSVVSHTQSSASAPVEDPARKGSDELSQHRAILAMQADAKRGRFSPVPQAVQGAQAQTPVPDAGIKSEHGRVFAGLGGGLPSSGPTSTPVGLAASPFKNSDVSSRLSEENLMKISRSSSGINKRSRKYDDDIRAESDVGDVKKTSRKKSKYAHAYKVDLEDNLNRRATPLSALNGNGVRRSDTPTDTHSRTNNRQIPRSQAQTEREPAFKPRKTIRIASLIKSVEHLPRRHLGNYIYDPKITKSETPRAGFEKFDVSIKPNLLPSFEGEDCVNCTYSVRVPRIWLQDRERSLIAKEAAIWGSGVYTDDSDVVAAAMHAGYMRTAVPEGVDRTMLEKVMKEQNAKIDGLIGPPAIPSEPEPNKDAVITLVVVPPLEAYTSSSRFGISSRTWPEVGSRTPHDGVSFAILKLEFVTGGVEGRRMGRTGIQKRKRMQQELKDRAVAQQILQKMLIEARMKRPRLMKEKKGKGSVKEPHPLSNAVSVEEVAPTATVTANDVGKDMPGLDVGAAPGEWLRQLEVEAGS